MKKNILYHHELVKVYSISKKRKELVTHVEASFRQLARNVYNQKLNTHQPRLRWLITTGKHLNASTVSTVSWVITRSASLQF